MATNKKMVLIWAAATLVVTVGAALALRWALTFPSKTPEPEKIEMQDESKSVGNIDGTVVYAEEGEDIPEYSGCGDAKLFLETFEDYSQITGEISRRIYQGEFIPQVMINWRNAVGSEELAVVGKNGEELVAAYFTGVCEITNSSNEKSFGFTNYYTVEISSVGDAIPEDMEYIMIEKGEGKWQE